MKQLSVFVSADNAWRLIWIRSILVLAQLGGIYYAYQSLRAPLAYDVLAMLLAIYSLVTFASAVRLRWAKPVSIVEFTIQLLLDVTLLTSLVYFSGGAANPLISLYIVFVAISAAVLPWRITWLLAGITIAAYSYLLFFYQSSDSGVDHSAHQMNSGGEQDGLFGLHILGMWLTFLVSTSLIAFFVSRMAEAIRIQDAKLADHRERVLQDEQLLAVATQAAGTAHELGTPLSTIAVVVNELRDTAHEQINVDAIKGDLALLDEQVQLCKSALQKMVTEAENEAESLQGAQTFFNQALERWQLMRPEAVFTTEMQLSSDVLIKCGLALRQAVINLLNNAADANPDDINISLAVEADEIVLRIRDYGAGFTPEVLAHFGQPFISSKPGGLGLGLYLSNATAMRYGGRIELVNMEEGGALTELFLPIVQPDDTMEAFDA